MKPNNKNIRSNKRAERAAHNKQMAIELTVAHNNFNRALTTYASFKVNDKAVGEDLVQDTFTKTWNYLVKGGKIATMKAFLYHVLNNIIIDEYRRRKYNTSSLEAVIDGGHEPADESAARLPDLIDGKAAMLLIKLLPKKYQEVMRMKHIQLLSHQEIGDIIGESKNTVAVQLHRGLIKLRLLYYPQVK